jgi:hypothetical protein
MVSKEGSERRTKPRIPAYFAVEISSAAKRLRCGVTRNASGQGLLVVTPSRFKPNDELELAVHVEGYCAQVKGHVVRIDENPVSSSELWRYRLGIELDEPLPTELLSRAHETCGPVSSTRARAS